MLIGLAHQLTVPDVALPAADDEPPDTGALLVPVALVLGLLLLQPAAASAPTAPSRAANCHLLMERLAEYVRDVARAILPPT